MDSKRIATALKKHAEFLQDGKLIRTSFNPIVYNRYLTNAEESLASARQLLSTDTSNLWVIVCSYYGMFYAAQAYIYKKGYKGTHELIHQVANEALIVLGRNDFMTHIMSEYEEERDRALEITSQKFSDYASARRNRSEFQYETTESVKKTKAETSFERSKDFFDMVRKILLKLK